MMQVFESRRGAGKTTTMIRWFMLRSGDRKRVLCVFSQQEKNRVWDIIKAEYPEAVAAGRVSLDDIVTPMDFRLRGSVGHKVGPTQIGIDNLDLVLPLLMGHHDIGPCTLTTIEEPAGESWSER